MEARDEAWQGRFEPGCEDDYDSEAPESGGDPRPEWERKEYGSERAWWEAEGYYHGHPEPPPDPEDDDL